MGYKNQVKQRLITQRHFTQINYLSIAIVGCLIQTVSNWQLLLMQECLPLLLFMKTAVLAQITITITTTTTTSIQDPPLFRMKNKLHHLLQDRVLPLY